MVGLVLVSHSHAAAEGTAALARQMAGEDVAIAAAGGLDGPDHEIGTDAMRVLAAIEEVWSADGVLILMDLGSAVLSAEMAIEFLDPERAAHVRLSGAPFVEGAVAAAVASRMGLPLAQVDAEARGGLAGKTAHLGGDAAAPPTAAPGAGTIDTEAIRRSFVVDLPHGLHARPAARLVQTAAGFDAHVTVTNASTGRGPVDARSLNAVATLGVTRGQTIDVSASGPQASAALEGLAALAARRFDEVEEAPEPAPPQASTTLLEPGAIRGLAASPGLVSGPVRRIAVPPMPPVPSVDGADPVVERATLDEARAAVRAEVRRRRDRTAARAGHAQAAIFEAHELFLDDEALLGPTHAAIEAGVGAAAGWAGAVEGVATTWEALDDPYLRARATDLRSVGREVLARLLGVPLPRATLPSPGILVADDLEPADAAGLDPETCLGIATARGGPTAHAAVLARALAIPAVVGLGEAIDDLPDGTTVILDGDRGLLHTVPTPEELAAVDAARALTTARREAARARAADPAVTSDGLTVHVVANIGSPSDAAAAVEAGADGVGLFRTEFLFLDRDELPGERDQEEVYRAVAQTFEGRPVVIRTLDVGGDKPLPALPLPHEDNPFLGVRGLRLGLVHPEVLGTQLRALARAAADHPIRVMVPMVTTRDEVRVARSMLRQACADVGVETPPAFGVMIEVPAAALAARALAAEVDFFSIGTNDLAQYTLAADRGNDRLGAIADPLHPAVLRLIAATAEAGAAAGIVTAVCGELGGDPAVTPLLLGLGVRELSMSAPSIPLVKDAVRGTGLGEARTLADRALEAATAGEVAVLLGR
jgi:phosphocarrier protein FPr